MRFLFLAVLTPFALVACSGSQSSGGASVNPSEATPASFAGDWKVSGYIVAPWFTGPGFAPEANPEILERMLSLSETASSGPTTLTCPAATSAVETAPVVGLFNGKVTDPAMAKSVLGIEGDAVAVMKQTCTANGGALQLYHLVKQDRLLLGANNMIYQFDRPKVETPAQ